jgi:hypothetical protein
MLKKKPDRIDVMKNYYYEVTFKDGRHIRRENVSKKIAEAMFKAMEYEMVLFEVESVSWGVL